MRIATLRSNTPWLSFGLALLAASFAAGCGDDGGSTGTGGGGTGGSATGGGGAGTGGDATGGAGGGSSTNGPIDTPPGEWTWVEFEGATCMNGTPAGIGVNLHPTSKDVVVFFQGGNACFNVVSCASTANTDGYGEVKLASEEALDYPIFDRNDANNPLKDYSYVFVPYCTGDVHAGERADVKIGNKTWQFHGYTNVSKFLERIVPTFEGAKNVMVTGVSAGGFGAAYNYDQIATAFGPGVDVALIDDSGPPMSEEFVPACLQKFFVETWGLDGTLPADCADCGTNGVFMEPLLKHLASKYDGQQLGLISSEEDKTIAQFWSFGNDNCANLNFPAEYAGTKYAAGLADMRDRVAAGSSFRFFLMPGDSHVFLNEPLDTTVRDGVTLRSWLTQAVTSDPAWPNVPAAPAPTP